MSLATVPRSGKTCELGLQFAMVLFTFAHGKILRSTVTLLNNITVLDANVQENLLNFQIMLNDKAKQKKKKKLSTFC